MARDESGAPGNYGAKKSSEYRGSTYGATAAKKKTATRKTVVTPGTKVSQATIDKIKAMGMTKALKGAANASPEMREALKRLYGAKRVAAAGGSSKPAAKSADAARAAATKPSSSGGKYVGSRFVPNTSAATKPSASSSVYKSADAARAAATKPAKTPAKSADAARAAAMSKSSTAVPYKKGFGATNMPNKNTKPGNFGTGTVRKAGTNMPKKTGTTDPFAKFVFGIGTALRGGSNNGMTAAQVAAENKRRAAAIAKANKNK